MGDAGGGNQPSLEARRLGSLEDGRAGGVVVVDANGAVVGLDAAGVGSGGRGRVGDVAVARLGPDSADEHGVDGELDGAVVAPVDVVSGESLGGWTEAIRNHLSNVSNVSLSRANLKNVETYHDEVLGALSLAVGGTEGHEPTEGEEEKTAREHCRVLDCLG